jgi:hypothetical protein
VPESIRPGRRALELGAAALVGLGVGLAAGLAAGVMIGRLMSGGEPAAPAQPVAGAPDVNAEIAQLSKNVTELSDAVRRLAASTAQRPRAGDPGARKAERPPPVIEPGVKFHDTFETGTDGWVVLKFAPLIIGEVARTEEEGRVREGKGALALSYDIEPGKVPLAVRMGPSARGINRLSLWMRTVHRPAEVVIGVQERDDSSYDTMVHLEPADGWKKLEYDLAQLTLADDSTDENGRLDFHEIQSVAVADAAGFLGGKGENVLLVDEVVGEHRAAKPGPPAKAKDQF